MTIEPATNADFAELDEWHYEPPYDFYEPDAEPVLNPERYFVARDGDGGLAGFYYYEPKGDVLEYGLGLRPDLTGRGLGLEFFRTGLEFGRERYRPGLVRLYVAAFNEFVEKGGRWLGDYATWMAIAESRNEWNWKLWPGDLQDPRSETVKRFANEHSRRVDFHRWAQFELERQLGEIAATCKAKGMEIGGGFALVRRGVERSLHHRHLAAKVNRLVDQFLEARHGAGALVRVGAARFELFQQHRQNGQIDDLQRRLRHQRFGFLAHVGVLDRGDLDCAEVRIVDDGWQRFEDRSFTCAAFQIDQRVNDAEVHPM